jgi:microcystin-dependent protein
MYDPFLAEIRMITWELAPKGWALCNGQLLPINQNQALFSLLGTTYGGNGVTTFALPDLRGRVAMHMTENNQGHTLGERAGEAAHTVTLAELPAHTHPVMAQSGAATTPVPTGNVLAAAGNAYGDATALVALHPGSVTSLGGSQPHENRQPFLTVNFIIALQGIFPSLH